MPSDPMYVLPWPSCVLKVCCCFFTNYCFELTFPRFRLFPILDVVFTLPHIYAIIGSCSYTSQFPEIVLNQLESLLDVHCNLTIIPSPFYLVHEALSSQLCWLSPLTAACIPFHILQISLRSFHFHPVYFPLCLSSLSSSYDSVCNISPFQPFVNFLLTFVAFHGLRRRTNFSPCHMTFRRCTERKMADQKVRIREEIQFFKGIHYRIGKFTAVSSSQIEAKEN